MKKLAMKKLARRQFIVNGCYKFGMMFGISILASKVIIQDNVAKNSMSNNLDLIDPVEKNNGKKNRSQRILVAYASQFGSTREIANRVSNRLAAGGNQVDVVHVNQVQSLSGYDAIIIGGAIQYDKWMGPARKFVNKYQRQLTQLPCACFFSCLTLSRHDDTSLAQAQGYTQKIFALFPQEKPVSVQGFAGVLDYRKMPVPVRIVAKVIMSIIGVKEGDYRDWPKIDNWIDSLPAALFTNNSLKKSI